MVAGRLGTSAVDERAPRFAHPAARIIAPRQPTQELVPKPLGLVEHDLARIGRSAVVGMDERIHPAVQLCVRHRPEP